MLDAQGWIKLHRKILDSPLWKDCTLQQKVVMITLLLMANHEPKKWIYNGEEFTCKAGQFVTSLKSIQQEAGQDISIMQIRTSLAKFEKFGFLTSKSTNKNRLITIVNWDLYQSESKDITSNLTSNQQATNKQLTTNKNVRMKECKNSIRDTKYVSLNDNDTVDIVENSKDEKLNMQSQIDEVIKAWNSIDGMRKVVKVGKGTKRYNLLVARINEYGIDKVLECVFNVQRSSFLKGYTSKDGWSADFDWIILPANFTKVLEGKYTDKPGKSNNPIADKNIQRPYKTSFHNYKQGIESQYSPEQLTELVRKLNKR